MLVRLPRREGEMMIEGSVMDQLNIVILIGHTIRIICIRGEVCCHTYAGHCVVCIGSRHSIAHSERFSHSVEPSVSTPRTLPSLSFCIGTMSNAWLLITWNARCIRVKLMGDIDSRIA